MTDRDNVVIEIIKKNEAKRIISIDVDNNTYYNYSLANYAYSVNGFLWSCSLNGSEITTLNSKSIIGDPIKMQQFCLGDCDAIAINYCARLFDVLRYYYGVLRGDGIMIINCPDQIGEHEIIDLFCLAHKMNACQISGVWVMWKDKRPCSCGGLKEEEAEMIVNLNKNYKSNTRIYNRVIDMKFSHDYWGSINSIISPISYNQNWCMIDAVYSMYKWITATRIYYPLNSMESIVEIGGGYGEMARAANGFGFRGLYTIVDDPKNFKIQKAYLDSFGIQSLFLSINDFKEIKCDLLISSRRFNKSIMDLVDSQWWFLGCEDNLHCNSYISYLRKRGIRRKMIRNLSDSFVYMIGRKKQCLEYA